MFDIKRIDRVTESLFEDINPANTMQGDSKLNAHLALNQNFMNFAGYGMPQENNRKSDYSGNRRKQDYDDEEEIENGKLRAEKKKKKINEIEPEINSDEEEKENGSEKKKKINEIEPEVNSEEKEEQPKPDEGPKFKIASNGNIVKVPEGYGTDDPLERDVIGILNDESLRWKVVKQDENKNIIISIRNVEGPEGLIIKNECTFPYNLEKVFNSIIDVSIEKEWNEAAAKSDVFEPSVDNEKWNKDYKYSYTIFPWPMSEREWVLKRRYTKVFADDPNQAMILATSTTHPRFPIEEKPVRAQMLIQGQHFQDLGNDTCKLTMISQADLKISESLQDIAEKKIIEEEFKFCEQWLTGLKMLK